MLQSGSDEQTSGTQPATPPPVSILYVDDEEALLTLVKLFLERTGEFRVEIRESAEDALKSAPIPSYDAIISDYQMPGMDGIGFLKAVREQNGDIPFILFTGRGREEVVIEAINNGADFYLQKGGAPKPQFAELAHKIKQSVRRRRAEAERIEQLNELVRTKEALQESESRYRTIIETIPDAIWEVTREGVFTYVSPRSTEIIGYTPEELNGREFFSILSPEGTEHIREILESIPTRQPGLSTFDLPAVHKDGTGRILNCRSYPIISADGTLTGFRGVSTDATEYTRNIQALRESELRLRSFIEATDDAVFLIDEEGKIIEWNQAAERFSGIAKEEAFGQNSWDLAFRMIAPEKRSERYLADLKEKMQQALRTGLTEFSESGIIETVRVDGSRIFSRQTIFPIQTEKGYRFGSIIRDVTREQKMTEALRESEERFRGIAERSPDLIFILDDAMRPTYVSPSSRTIIGFDPEEMVGRSPEFALRTIFSQSGPEIQAAVSRTLKGELVDNCEIQIQKRDGTPVYVNLHVIPVIYEGIFAGAQVSMRDITRIKAAEMALRESEEKYITMFRKNPVPLTLVDLPGSFFTDVNEAFERNSGFSRSDIIGKRPGEIGIFPYPDEYTHLSEEIRERGHVSGLDMHCRAKGGEIRNVLFSSQLVDIHGQPGILSAIEDITRLKSAESAMNAIVTAIVETTGKESLDRITGSIRSWLSADCVFIGTITQDGENLEILSMILDGTRVSAPPAPFAGSPGEEVVRSGFTMIPDGISTRFPGCSFISTNRFRGFIGEAIRNPGGEAIGILGIFSRTPLSLDKYAPGIIEIIAIKAGADIERTRIEETLVNNEQMLSDAMDLARLAGWEFDVPTQVFTFNDRFYDLYGTTAEREGGYLMDVGTYTREFVHPADLSLVMMEGQKALENSDPSYCSDSSHRIIRRDGEIRHVSVRIRVTADEEGKVLKTYGATQDITDYRIIEENLRRSNRQLNLLTSITRHDIINKISGFSGYLNLIEAETDNPGITGYIQKIYLAIGEVQSLIEFSRIYEKLGSDQPGWIALDNILTFSSFPEGITLKRNIPEISLFADPMIERVFYNLLDNSIRYGQSVTTITISASIQDQSLTILWEDDGIGIPAQEKEKIFASGYGKNTGFGLFLAREILSLTGISITETGTPGEGARFEITVPSESFTIGS